ncbi:hypothetical protein Droror1_Dr00016743 [Drosera rotundifolia]
MQDRIYELVRPIRSCKGFNLRMGFFLNANFEANPASGSDDELKRPLKTTTSSQMTVVLKVVMSCQGCVGAVKRVLGKMEGVETYDINLEEQRVTVKGNVQPDAVLQTVSKTGKKTTFWEEEAPAPAAADALAPAEVAVPAV